MEVKTSWEEKEQLIRDTSDRIKGLFQKTEQLTDTLGTVFDSPLFDQVFCLADAHLLLVEEVVGSDWLSYWVYDCDFGKTPGEVRLSGEKEPIMLSSLEDLLYIMKCDD